MYANFCLKNKKFDEAFILYEEIASQSGEFAHKINLAALMIQRRRTS